MRSALVRFRSGNGFIIQDLRGNASSPTMWKGTGWLSPGNGSGGGKPMHPDSMACRKEDSPKIPASEQLKKDTRHF